MEVEQTLVHPLMRHFMYGQFANLFKFALWWVSLAPLTFAILDGSTTAIGVGRIVYNAALCLTSPIGGLIVERIHPKTILVRAAGVRFFVWCFLVPLTWFLFESSFVTTSQIAVYILLMIGLFIDGICVGLSTVLDIDLCGVDVLANTYGLEVTDEHRNQFNSRQEFFFACCFVIFAPAMAFVGLGIHRGFDQATGVSEHAVESGTLCAIFFATFLVATVLQFYFFGKFPMGGASKDGEPNESSPLTGQGMGNDDSAHSLDTHNHISIDEDTGNINSGSENVTTTAPPPAGDGGEGPEGPPPPFMEQLKAVPADLKGSLEVIWANPPVLWRLVFLGFEIAFEDAAIVVIASQMGILLPWLGGGDSVKGNIWTAVAVAVGKFGGAIASVIMMKFYKPPEDAKKFTPIFALITLSCIFIFGFPLITDGWNNGMLGDNAARALFLLTFFLYFFVSTLPKLGLMCLFQSMVSQIENGPRVFGFIAIVATTFDAGVIMILSVLFVQFSTSKALWITACIYMAHGLLELLVGPTLVLKPLAAAQAAAASGVVEDSPRNDEGPSESTSLVAHVQPSPTASGSEPVAVSGGAGGDTPVAGGTFTQRSAAVPIAATPRSHTGGNYLGTGSQMAAGSLRAGGSSMRRNASGNYLDGGESTAVISTSMHGAHGGIVQRRRSNLDGPGFGEGGGQGGASSQYTRKGSALTPRGGSQSPRSPR